MDKNNYPSSLSRTFNANQAALIEVARLLGQGTTSSIDEAEQRMAVLLNLSQGVQDTILKLKEQLKIDLEDRKDFVTSILKDLDKLDTLDEL